PAHRERGSPRRAAWAPGQAVAPGHANLPQESPGSRSLGGDQGDRCATLCGNWQWRWRRGSVGPHAGRRREYPGARLLLPADPINDLPRPGQDERRRNHLHGIADEEWEHSQRETGGEIHTEERHEPRHPHDVGGDRRGASERSGFPDGAVSGAAGEDPRDVRGGHVADDVPERGECPTEALLGEDRRSGHPRNEVQQRARGAEPGTEARAEEYHRAGGERDGYRGEWKGHRYLRSDGKERRSSKYEGSGAQRSNRQGER